MNTTTTDNTTSVSVTVGGQEIVFETGKLAKQADGAVVVRSGDTMVLATAQGRQEAREGQDFFPLTVDVEEKMYAAGKIPGGFFKREGRATERATLTARMIDRPIRPLWPKGFRNEVQVICTVLSADMITPHDILCINGASAALMISSLPFSGPVGAVRIGLVEGELVVNPSLEATDESELDLIVVGTKDGLTMVEAGANQVPEDVLLEALEKAHRKIVKLCEAQEELREKAGKPKWLDESLTAELRAAHGSRIAEQIAKHGLKDAATAVEELQAELCAPLTMTSTDEDITRLTQVRSSLAQLLEEARLTATMEPVRAQFMDALTALTDAEQDSKELKSAKRHLLFDEIIENVQLPFPVAPVTEGSEEPTAKDSITKQTLKKAGEALYKELVRRKIAVDKRQARRPRHGRGAPGQLRGQRLTTHAWVGALHARADADHDAAHARHGEGRPANRRPLARGRAPVHAPLQLPALLGRGDRLHAGSEAPRHRPWRARAASTRGGHPECRRLPVHDPARLRDARVERLLVHGLGLRLDARAPGRRRADLGTGQRNRDGPGEGGRRLRHPHGHPGSGGSPRRHGLQGRRDHARASPPSRWTSRSPVSPRRSCARRSSRRSGRASSSST